MNSSDLTDSSLCRKAEQLFRHLLLRDRVRVASRVKAAASLERSELEKFCAYLEKLLKRSTVLDKT